MLYLICLLTGAGAGAESIVSCKATFKELTGHDVGAVSITGASDSVLDEACCKACKANTDCTFWVREAGSSGKKNCWLKNEPGQRVDTANRRGGGLEPPHVGAFICPPDATLKKKAYSVPINGKFLPILASQPPGAAPSKAVVVVHGKFTSDQGLYFNSLLGEVKAKGLDKSILVVAPGWPDKPCSGLSWDGGSSSLEALQWSHSGDQWILGLNSDSKEVTSYQAIDDLILWLEGKYKSLKEFVVSGFSAGGQTIQRWAVMSPQGKDGKTISGKPMRIVVGSPGTVLYLDAKRPDETCSPNKATGVNHTCTSFAKPEGGARRRGTHVAKTCGNTWNNYGYGLDELGEQSDYLKKTIPSTTQYAKFILDRFRTKDFRLIVGTKDQKSCEVGECSRSCAAEVTGSNRLQRALNFKSHLQDVFPGYVPKFGTFEGGHVFQLFFKSDLFNTWALRWPSKTTAVSNTPATHAVFLGKRSIANGSMYSSSLVGEGIHQPVDMIANVPNISAMNGSLAHSGSS